MQKRPGQVDELFVDWGATGATIGATIYDAASTLIAARTTGFVESPAGSGGYVLAGYTFPTDRGTYRIRYDDDGGIAAVGHVTWEDLTITSSTGDPFDGDTYCSIEELFRVLKIRTPTQEQTDAGTRVLVAATGEIDSEIDREDDDPVSGWEVSLAAEVCLERAVEHWQQGSSPFGLLGLGAETGVAFASADSWKRHALKLAPLKRQWGFA